MKVREKYLRATKIWLWIGLGMVLVQVLIGGVTRLTDSGLSITEWELVKGVIPPLNEPAWQEAFQKYQSAAEKQYEGLHADMSLEEFKLIYFWEWFHRLWARMMGLVFIIPFLFFLAKGAFDSKFTRLLLAVLGSAALAGIFGWIMVASGLGEDTRTWVSAYKLIVHLIIAVLTLGLIYWGILQVSNPQSLNKSVENKIQRPGIAFSLLLLLLLQIVLGGLMAGMRAGLIHPHWTIFVHWDSLSGALGNLEEFNRRDLLDYEASVFVKAWIHLVHRIVAYVLGLGLIFFGIFTLRRMGNRKEERHFAYRSLLKKNHLISIFLVCIQILLGILTVHFSKGGIPVLWGVLHQMVALLLFLNLLKIWYIHRL